MCSKTLIIKGIDLKKDEFWIPLNTNDDGATYKKVIEALTELDDSFQWSSGNSLKQGPDTSQLYQNFEALYVRTRINKKTQRLTIGGSNRSLIAVTLDDLETLLCNHEWRTIVDINKLTIKMQQCSICKRTREL